jgi:hypothetical protein
MKLIFCQVNNHEIYLTFAFCSLYCGTVEETGNGPVRWKQGSG